MDVVAMTVSVSVIRRMVVMMRVRLGRASRSAGGGHDLDARGGDSRTHHARLRHRVAHAKRAQRGPQRLNRYAGVHEGPQQHVAGRARETLDVHHARHGPSLDSLMEQYSTSARTR